MSISLFLSPLFLLFFLFFPNVPTVKFLRRKVFFFLIASLHTGQTQTLYLMDEGRGQSFEQTIFFVLFLFFPVCVVF